VLADWVAYNLIAHNGETLTIRKGDQVKFVALPEGAHGGQFDVEVVVDVNGEVTRSPNTAPIIRSFPEAGTFTVSGTYTHGNDTLTASVQVRVVDWTFTGAEPACPLGSEREWTINLPQGAVLEADPTIQMELLGSSPTTNNEYQITASLLASEVNGDHRIVARLFAGGPILGTVKVNPFWIIPNADPYMAVVARYEDCELWQAVMVQKHLPPGMDIVIDVFATGVLLDDYTVTRRLTVGDFNAAGEYLIRLFHPNEREGSTCFKIETQQEGQFVGIAR
jgi:hypothetical protein